MKIVTNKRKFTYLKTTILCYAFTTYLMLTGGFNCGSTSLFSIFLHLFLIENIDNPQMVYLKEPTRS